MSLSRIRPRHVDATSLAVFVALVGFEGARMAAGKDPALARPAASTPSVGADPGAAGADSGAGGYEPGGGFDRGSGGDDGSGIEGNANGGSGGGFDDGGAGGSQQQEVPQPESRLS